MENHGQLIVFNHFLIQDYIYDVLLAVIKQS